eukprot:m.179425 g.179425  ORF g.179425 m.179425 type:complete len:68 (-) comp14640_c4_seq19:9856-10059(-)
MRSSHLLNNTLLCLTVRLLYVASEPQRWQVEDINMAHTLVLQAQTPSDLYLVCLKGLKVAVESLGNQ